MPSTSLVCVPYHLVITSCYGELAIREIQADAARLRDHPEFRPDFRQLIDLSHVVKLHLNFRELYQLKHACDPFSNLGKRAVFAPSDLTFGMSRMYQSILNTSHFEVFRSLSEALGWLELDPAALEDALQNIPEESPGYLILHPNRSDS